MWFADLMTSLHFTIFFVYVCVCFTGDLPGWFPFRESREEDVPKKIK